MDRTMIEVVMSIISFGSLSSWLPQIGRILKRKQTDDFSLVTTAILMFCNVAWLMYGLYINSISLTIQQSLTVIMLVLFGGLIIKYRTRKVKA